jgi:hypothetical protein
VLEDRLTLWDYALDSGERVQIVVLGKAQAPLAGGADDDML